MASIFKYKPTIEEIEKLNKNTITEALGMEHIEIGDDYIIARLPVDHRTKQPFGLLHGGASVVLAEGLGSIASVMVLDSPNTGRVPVGVEINANHIKSAKSGWVYGKATAIHIGGKTHIWEIKITNEDGDLICISRLTTMVINANK
jgi:1,4-dihydroxy-2-naphthoyl-CoA hydrolase